VNRLVAFILAAILIGSADRAIAAQLPKPESGEVTFPADRADSTVPELYRLEESRFRFEMKLKHDLVHSGVEIHTLQFPSPIKSGVEANDIVHATYFRPKSAGKKPAVLILDILDGKQIVSESQALWLAQHDVCAVVMYMAYYGPRRPEGSKERMITPNLEKSLANIKQTVCDCRRTLRWLETRDEVDAKKLGVLGTSLGSFIGGVVAGVEPKVRSASLLLGGGGLVEAFWDHPQATLILKGLALVGFTKDKFKQLIDPYDPLTYANQLKSKKLLLIAASQDDVVPPKAMKQLWEAVGKPEMIWVEATHVGAAGYMFQMMRAVTKHVKE
jgi:dienelactone hydrolase